MIALGSQASVYFQFSCGLRPYLLYSPYDPASCREGNTPVVFFSHCHKSNLQPTSIEWNMLVAYWPQFWTFKAPMSTAHLVTCRFCMTCFVYCRNWQRIILERRLSWVSCPHVWRNFVFMLQAWSCHFVFMFFLKCHIEMRYWYCIEREREREKKKKKQHVIHVKLHFMLYFCERLDVFVLFFLYMLFFIVLFQ